MENKSKESNLSGGVLRTLMDFVFIFYTLRIIDPELKGDEKEELLKQLKNAEQHIKRILQNKYFNRKNIEKNLKRGGQHLQEIGRDFIGDVNKILQQDFPELASRVKFSSYRDVPYNQKYTTNIYLNDKREFEWFPINQHPKNYMPILTPYPDLKEVIFSVEMHLSKIEKFRNKIRIYGSIQRKKPKRLFKEFEIIGFDI